MPSARLKVLLIIEQCNPEWTSVPLIGYRYYMALRRLADVTLATHGRNQKALADAAGSADVVYIPENHATQRYFRAVARVTTHGGHINWPLQNALTYPVYAEFDRKVYRRFRAAVAGGAYDVVHAFSPIIPRYPVKMIEACRNTPFILGPVNGGLPFPPAFADVARKEFARFRSLRSLSRLLPGYRKTYRGADKILAGSAATLDMIRQMFAIDSDRIELFPENGVPAEFFTDRRAPRPEDPVRLLFVGRLVPYKCAEIVIEALGRLAGDIRQRTTLTVVGDGPESEDLKARARHLGLTERVTFAGWVGHAQTLDYYRRSDIFCFPAIREFGGAVVLEAMAAGLPCIVADHGGIAEYVTEETGFRIAPSSRTYLCEQMARHIETLAADAALHARMSAAAAERARAFEWDAKARRTIRIYTDIIDRKSSARKVCHV